MRPDRFTAPSPMLRLCGPTTSFLLCLGRPTAAHAPILSAGIPSTVVISASFDDVIAITGYAVFSHIAITGQGDVAWAIAQGPMQVVFGIVGGLLIGFALSYTRIFDTLVKRIVGLYGGSAFRRPARCTRVCGAGSAGAASAGQESRLRVCAVSVARGASLRVAKKLRCVHRRSMADSQGPFSTTLSLRPVAAMLAGVFSPNPSWRSL